MVNYRLTETMESRIHRKVYVRFGGEYPETRHRNMKMGVGYLAYIRWYARFVHDSTTISLPVYALADNVIDEPGV